MSQSTEPVTVAITHHVKPGQEDAFDEWIRGINRIASGFDGYRGYVVLPRTKGSQDRHVAVRFESLDKLNAYWDSDESQSYRKKLGDLVTEPSEIQPEVGIEHWCMRSDASGPPPRHRMSVAIFIAIFPLVSVIPPRLTPWLAEFMPRLLAGAITTAVLVGIMSYVAMPLVTRALSSWLRPKAAPR